MSAKKSFGKGLLAGAVGGALGTLVLNLFQKASLEGTRKAENHTSGNHQYTHEQEGLLHSYEKAHVLTAQKVAGVVGAEVPREHRVAAAATAEFAFGIVCAALYGGLAEYVPAVTTGFGGIYGAALFAGAAEIVLPAIGFVPPVSRKTPVQHAGGLSGNVVYGMVTEAVRRAIRH